jgi:hypothetical protein
LDLLEQQASALSAAAAPEKIDYQGDERRYRARRRELEAILDRLGIRSPFPWDSLAECLAWGKTEFPRNYAARRADILARKDRVAELLQRRIDDNAAGDPRAEMARLASTAKEVLTDPSAIRVELARIEANIHTDPSAVIGKAKNLIEATAKAVLLDLGKPIPDTSKVPQLAAAAMETLGLGRRAAGHDRHVASILGWLHSVTNGVAALRNDVGDAHGPATAVEGLDLRYGRLAVRSAIAWCAFMLETLEERRKTSTPGK